MADYSPAEGGEPVVIDVPAPLAGSRLDVALAQLLPEHSRSRLKAWIEGRRVRLEGRTPKPSEKVHAGSRIEVVPPAAAESEPSLAQAIGLTVVHEDVHILVLDKPAGLVTHPGAGNPAGTLLNALLYHAPQLARLPRAGIVHRLDKDTSGLMVVAKTLAAHTYLVRRLAMREITRVYLAVVEGSPPESGEVDAPIGRHPVQRTRMAVVARGKPARTHFRVIERLAGAALVECHLDTGRTHQIRVHMKSIGHPLLGDPVYGSKTGRARFHRQALHATRLALAHPEDGVRREWLSVLPADMAALVAALRP